MTAQVVALGALVLVTAVLGVLWRASQGRVRERRPAVRADWSARSEELGFELGTRATFVQFSAEVCTPCRATARVLSGLAGAESGVTHTELDVDRHPDLVKAERVLRAPTVVVLDGAGREVARSSGAMTPRQAREALSAAERSGERTESTPGTGRVA